MNVLVSRVESVKTHPDADGLSVIKLNGTTVVAMKEDGKHRFKVGELAIHVPVNAIVPLEVLKERGYYDEEKGKGLLKGSKGNRTGTRNFRGIDSDGLIWKTEGKFPGCFVINGIHSVGVSEGTDLREFFGITEYKPE